MNRAVLLAVACCLCASTAAAREDASAYLEWPGVSDDPGCITRVDLEQRIEARMGRKVFVPKQRADIILEASAAAATDSRRLVSVTLRSQNGAFWGTRQIEVNADCEALQDSLILMLSLTADIAKEEVERRVQLDRRSRVSVGVQALASSVYGLLPSIALGPELALGVNSPLLGWLELSAALYPQKSLGSPQEAGFEAGLLTLKSCPLALHGVDISVWACAALRGGYLNGKGYGFDASFERTEAIVSTGAALRGVWEVAYPFFLVSNVGADVAVQGAEFYYEQAGTRRAIFRTEPALFMVNIGFGLTLQ